MSQSKLSQSCIDEYRLFIYKAERLPMRRLVWLIAGTRVTLVPIIVQLVPYDRILRKEKTLEASPLLTQFCAIVYIHINLAHEQVAGSHDYIQELVPPHRGTGRTSSYVNA